MGIFTLSQIIVWARAQIRLVTAYFLTGSLSLEWLWSPLEPFCSIISSELNFPKFCFQFYLPMVAVQEKHRDCLNIYIIPASFLLTTRPLVALSHKFTSAIIFTDAPGSHWLCSVCFSKENWMASPCQGGFVPAAFQGQAGCYCLCWICVFSFHPRREFLGQFCSALRGDGEVWSFPVHKPLDCEGFLYLRNVCMWERSISICVWMCQWRMGNSRRGRRSVCAHRPWTHTQSLTKVPVGNPH